jgi:hypothetical protein
VKRPAPVGRADPRSDCRQSRLKRGCKKKDDPGAKRRRTREAGPRERQSAAPLQQKLRLTQLVPSSRFNFQAWLIAL